MLQVSDSRRVSDTVTDVWPHVPTQRLFFGSAQRRPAKCGMPFQPHARPPPIPDRGHNMNPPQNPSPSHLTVRRCVQADDAAWLRLRQALWPECARAEHLAEMADIVAASERWAVFLVYADARPDAVGVAEVALRYDYVNG